MSEWRSIESAPKERPVLVYCHGEQYVAEWHEEYGEWGVSANSGTNQVRTFVGIGPRVFAGTIIRMGPICWQPLPEPPEGL